MIELKIEYLPHYDENWGNLKYAYEGDACFDLYNANEEDITLKPLERFAFPTGCKFEIPDGFELRISGRSGLASKHGIGLANGIGVVDAHYRGEVKVLIVNLSNEEYTIKRGERIAQARLISLVPTKLIKVDKVNEDTSRGANGFGSSGK